MRSCCDSLAGKAARRSLLAMVEVGVGLGGVVQGSFVGWMEN